MLCMAYDVNEVYAATYKQTYAGWLIAQQRVKESKQSESAGTGWITGDVALCGIACTINCWQTSGWSNRHTQLRKVFIYFFYLNIGGKGGSHLYAGKINTMNICIINNNKARLIQLPALQHTGRNLKPVYSLNFITLYNTAFTIFERYFIAYWSAYWQAAALSCIVSYYYYYYCYYYEVSK